MILIKYYYIQTKVETRQHNEEFPNVYLSPVFTFFYIHSIEFNSLLLLSFPLSLSLSLSHTHTHTHIYIYIYIYVYIYIYIYI